ncbi:hypothetical protein [Photobacterium obscurum]|nr:hypothetical protein [Photobacterium obscurum]
MNIFQYRAGAHTKHIQPFDWEEYIEKAIEAIDEFFRQQWDQK